MAEVFKGKSVSMEGFERLVAIKRVLPNLAQNTKFIGMFLDEAKLSLSLAHANIVQVFDLGRSGDSYFIVMEYVEGTNLKTIMQVLAQERSSMTVAESVYIAIEICKGLTFAHEKRDLQGRHLNIVHRDVSPPNILISIEGEVKLTDFGLAKARSQVELTDPGVVKGKFGYLSPEAANGEEVDALTDLFACGIVLWEMLAGRRLFYGKTDMQTLELVRRAEIPDLATYNPDVPRELEQICRRALARDKTQRYQSGQELGRDLSEFLFSRSMRVTAYDIQALVRKVLRMTRLEDSRTASPEVTALVQQELDRIIRIEQDALNGQPQTTDEVTEDDDFELKPSVMEDPRTWEDVWDDIDLGLPDESSEEQEELALAETRPVPRLEPQPSPPPTVPAPRLHRELPEEADVEPSPPPQEPATAADQEQEADQATAHRLRLVFIGVASAIVALVLVLVYVLALR